MIHTSFSIIDFLKKLLLLTVICLASFFFFFPTNTCIMILLFLVWFWMWSNSKGCCCALLLLRTHRWDFLVYKQKRPCELKTYLLEVRILFKIVLTGRDPLVLLLPSFVTSFPRQKWCLYWLQHVLCIWFSALSFKGVKNNYYKKSYNFFSPKKLG